MATEIRSLRVSAEMDVSKYAAGAAQKTAADRAMGTSGKEAAAGIRAVGDAAVVTNTKITSVNDGVERLKRQFVTGYAASVDFDRGLKTIGSGLDKGKLSAEQASVAVANLSQKYGVAADASHTAARGNAALAEAITTANARVSAQSAAVDDLTSSYQRMAAEARIAHAAEQSQSAFNSQLGVGRPSVGSASDSASFFAAELARKEEIDRLRAQQNGASFGSDINSRFGIISGGSSSARDSASVFEEAAREADRLASRVAALRAQIDPAGTAQARLNEELAEYTALAARAEISATELAQAQALARARYDAVVPGRHGTGDNDNNVMNRRQNATYQYFDIGQGLAGGMPLGMIAAQQGPQLAQLYAGQGGVKTALSDVTALAAGTVAAIGPIGIALGVTGAAALAYYTLTKRESKTTDELLKAHQDSIKRVGDLWGDAAEQRSKYGRVSTDVVTLGLDNSISAMTKRLRENVSSGEVGSGISSAINANMDATGLNARQFRETTIFKQLKIDFDALHQATVAGRPDVFGLVQRLQDIRRNSDNSGIRQMAEDALEALKPFHDLAEALREADLARRRLFEDRGDNGRLLSRGTTNSADAGNLALYESRENVSRGRSQAAYDAQIASLNARSPQERAGAASQSAASQYNSDESPAARRIRIEQAGTLALAQAEKTLNEAREARARNLDKIVADQQLEISLIGKTAGDAAGLRREYELIGQLKEEARQNGGTVDQDEIDKIKEATSELSKMADALARAKMLDDLKFEREQLGRSDVDQQIATRQRGAGLPVDLKSDEADQMREIERAKELRAQGKGFVTDLVSGLRDGEKFGEAFGKSILNGFARAGEKQLDKLVDSFMSWLFPAGGGTSAASAGPGIVSSVLGAANDNIPTGMAPVGAVTRAALAPTTDIGNYIAKSAAARGIDPSIALRVAKSEGGLDSWNLQSGVIKNGVREPSFGPFQLYKGGGLGNKFMEKTGLDPANASAGPAGVDFALDEAKKSGWGAWYGAKKAGIGNFEGINSNVGAESASAALDKLASNAGVATKGLGQLGGGLTKIGEGLSTSFFPAAPTVTGGGGGLGGWLSSLFGGGLSQATISKYTPLTGLFADGTDSAPGGVAMVGERGRELVNLPRGSQVVPNHKTEAMLSRAANGNSGNPQPSKIDLHVTVVGGSGDEHVKSLARQGAQEVLGAYDISQKRGGVGRTNNAYTTRKG